MQLDIYNKTTIETETIVYDIVREWQTVYTHKSITISDIIFLYQLAQACPHNVLHFLVTTNLPHWALTITGRLKEQWKLHWS